MSRPAPGESSAGNSWSPRISADGTYVAFVSQNDHLPLAQAGDQDDVFIWDYRTRSIIERIDLDQTPATTEIDFSADGRFVIAIVDGNTSFAAADTNSVPDAYVFDRDSDAWELVSQNSNGTVMGYDSVHGPSISGDGRYVSFDTYRDLTEELPNPEKRNVWVRDRQTGTIHLVSRYWGTGLGTTGTGANRSRLSDLGNVVGFITYDKLDPRDSSQWLVDVYEGSVGGDAFDVVDPNPTLLTNGSVVNDPLLLRELGRPVNGMAADGVTRVLLRYNAHPSATGNVRFSIADETELLPES